LKPTKKSINLDANTRKTLMQGAERKYTTDDDDDDDES